MQNDTKVFQEGSTFSSFPYFLAHLTFNAQRLCKLDVLLLVRKSDGIGQGKVREF